MCDTSLKNLPVCLYVTDIELKLFSTEPFGAVFRSSRKHVVNTKHLETLKKYIYTYKTQHFMSLVVIFLIDSLQLMRSFVKTHSRFMRFHMWGVWLEEGGKTGHKSVYVWFPTTAACAGDWQSLSWGSHTVLKLTLSWWSQDDRFKTELDYSISPPKTTASSVRESCLAPSSSALRYTVQVDMA